MKKIMFGSVGCEINVMSDFIYEPRVFCEYEKDTIAYAVERLFTHNMQYGKTFALESWKLRLAKGKARRKKEFELYVPAQIMELPGDTVEIIGEIDVNGVNVKSVALLLFMPIYI